MGLCLSYSAFRGREPGNPSLGPTRSICACCFSVLYPCPTGHGAAGRRAPSCYRPRLPPVPVFSLPLPLRACPQAVVLLIDGLLTCCCSFVGNLSALLPRPHVPVMRTLPPFLPFPQAVVLLIDGLDQADGTIVGGAAGHDNPIVQLVEEHLPRLPGFVRLVLTSRWGNRMTWTCRP